MRMESSRQQDSRFHQELARSFFEEVGDALFVFDPKTLRVVDVNPAAQRLTGRRRQELLDMPLADLFSARLEKDAEDLRDAIQITQIFQSNEEYSLTRKEGTPLEVNLTVTRIHVRPTPLGLIVARDISHRKRNKQARRALEEKLHRSERLESIGKMAGGIAHDFRNLITPIQAFARLAMEELDEQHPVQEYLRNMVEHTNLAKELTAQILTLNNRGEQRRTPESLVALIDEALLVARQSVPGNIRVEVGLMEGPTTVYADPTQLKQVVINLFNNAVQALDLREGTVAVRLARIAADDPFIRSRAGLSKTDHFKLSVEDDGPGIPKDKAAKIFEPFYTTKTGGKGSGVGLAVVQSIVLNHGGEILVESEPGKGAAFIVCLPCVEERPPEADIARKPETPPETSLGSILFVDDDESIVKLGSTILRRAGFNVSPHTDSQEALDAFAAAPRAFDLVITDMMMPVMKGDELARRIHEKTPDMPIILISGFSGNVTGENCTEYGFSQLIEKPMEPAQLVEAARRVIAANSP